MALDHGMLNLPLSKRGNIDREIDQYKRGVAAKARAGSRARHLDRHAARAALREAPDAKIASLATKLGLTITQTRQRLQSGCVSSPRLVLGFLAL